MSDDKTVDTDHMTVALCITLDVLRTVKSGNRMEAVNQLETDLIPELFYMKQRLSQMGLSPLVRINKRTTV